MLATNVLDAGFSTMEHQSITTNSVQIGAPYRIDLNQGMDARLVTPEIAEILSKIKWIRFLRFSCDQESQIEPILRTCELLGKYGVRPYRIFIYLLITPDIDNAVRRVEALKGLKGINLYAQAERNDRIGITPNREQRVFAQKYIYSGEYRKETWGEFRSRHPEYFKEVLKDGKGV